MIVDDRNLTVHTYNEALAVQLMKRLPDHVAVLRTWLSQLENRTPIVKG